MKNFFEQQDKARTNTTVLVVLFIVATAVIVASVYVVALMATGVAIEDEGMFFDDMRVIWWDPDIFMLSTLATVAVIGGGAYWKVHQLSKGGGKMVAEQLGGRLIHRNTDSLREKQLLNVVEEMAIASGVSVPSVYVLDQEPGINAFAAGFNSNEAAIAVSDGCLQMLDRDELQGVIAHEFSHILNGDMRLNINIMGVLFGLLILVLAGRTMMHVGAGGSRSSSRRSDGGSYVILVGLALIIIGYIGRFFGQVIKSAISRQREYLADASAVQFTRNPKGLAGALKKIGGYDEGSRIKSPDSEEVSHMFFGRASGHSLLDSVFATHPPLKERIERVDPSFDGTIPAAKPAPAPSPDSLEGPDQAASGLAAGGAASGPSTQRAANGGDGGGAGGGGRIQIDADSVVNSSGQMTSEHVDHAHNILESVPPEIRRAAGDAYSAAGVVFALLLDDDKQVRDRQLGLLEEKLTDKMAQLTHRYMRLLDDFSADYRLPLVELMVPELRELSNDQYTQFVEILEALILADDRVTPFEFSLEKLIKHRLEAREGAKKRSRRAKYYSINAVRNEVEVVLSFLAHAGHDSEAEAKRAFEAGAAKLRGGAGERVGLLANDSFDIAAVDAALDRIDLGNNGVKRQVVEAAAHCALADEEVTVEEAELLRAVCEVIDVPMPPFLRG